MISIGKFSSCSQIWSAALCNIKNEGTRIGIAKELVLHENHRLQYINMKMRYLEYEVRTDCQRSAGSVPSQ